MPTPENFVGFFFSKDTQSDMLYDNTAEEIIDIALRVSQSRHQPASQAFYIVASIHDLLANDHDGTMQPKIDKLLEAGRKINPTAPWEKVLASGRKLKEKISSGNANPVLIAFLGHGMQAWTLISF